MRGWLSGLAPRRRALVVSLLAAAIVATVAIVIAAIPRSRPPVHADDPPGPVVLVPGYGGGRTGLLQLADRIRATGRTAIVLELPGDGTGDLAVQARALQKAVAGLLDGGAHSVDVVGYSAGGVVVRLWLADDGGAAEARRVVSLGSPLHGARIAGVGEALVPGACPVACQQLAPGSTLLNRLAATRLSTAWMSVWTTDDETVVPPDSARLAGAVNVVAQDVCPGVVISHGGLPTDPLVTGIVLRALGASPLVAPTAADCARLGG